MCVSDPNMFLKHVKDYTQATCKYSILHKEHEPLQSWYLGVIPGPGPMTCEYQGIIKCQSLIIRLKGENSSPHLLITASQKIVSLY